LEFGVLGPLQVNGGDVALAGKQRVVLAILLLNANRVVPVDALIDAVWDDKPPPTARLTLQGYVKHRRPAGHQPIAQHRVFSWTGLTFAAIWSVVLPAREAPG
jgi:DNA-binding SARP family transcriptional activator